MATGVYCIRCEPTCKVYIGSSSLGIEERWACHLSGLRSGKHENKILQRAWDKYGEESFTWTVIVECDPEHVLLFEQFEIDSRRSWDRRFGFNICRIAGNTRGRKHGEDARSKIAAAACGRVQSEDHVSKRVSTWKKTVGDRQSTEWVSRRAAARRGKPGSLLGSKQTAEHIANRFTDQTKANMSAAKRGRRSNSARLTDDDVREIRMRVKNGESQSDVAVDYGLCRASVSHIMTGKSYSDVKDTVIEGSALFAATPPSDAEVKSVSG